MKGLLQLKKEKAWIQNYNKELDPYGVEKRRGWQAINLFFNSAIDATNVLFSDMPWSRAGDYVLFQAQKDLVCVSSACPDDIDPQYFTKSGHGKIIVE